MIGRIEVLSALAKVQKCLVTKRPHQMFGAVCLVLSFGIFMMISDNVSAKQKPRPVVALTCEGELNLCRAVVQVLAEKAPGRIIRINPNPIPDIAFELRLTATDEAGYLSWADGSGDSVTRAGHDDFDFATRMIEQASPGLDAALNSHDKTSE